MTSLLPERESRLNVGDGELYVDPKLPRSFGDLRIELIVIENVRASFNGSDISCRWFGQPNLKVSVEPVSNITGAIITITLPPTKRANSDADRTFTFFGMRDTFNVSRLSICRGLLALHSSNGLRLPDLTISLKNGSTCLLGTAFRCDPMHTTKARVQAGGTGINVLGIAPTPARRHIGWRTEHLCLELKGHSIVSGIWAHQSITGYVSGKSSLYECVAPGAAAVQLKRGYDTICSIYHDRQALENSDVTKLWCLPWPPQKNRPDHELIDDAHGHVPIDEYRVIRDRRRLTVDTRMGDGPGARSSARIRKRKNTERLRALTAGRFGEESDSDSDSSSESEAEEVSDKDSSSESEDDDEHHEYDDEDDDGLDDDRYHTALRAFQNGDDDWEAAAPLANDPRYSPPSSPVIQTAKRQRRMAEEAASKPEVSTTSIFVPSVANFAPPGVDGCVRCEHLETAIERFLCILCHNVPKGTMAYPCGHTAYCRACKDKLGVTSQRTCGVCRGNVERYINVFHA